MHFSVAKGKNELKTPYGLFFDMRELWYCGLVANVVDVFEQTKDERLKVFMNKFEHHIFKVQQRLPDGTLIRVDNGRKVVQSDDAYMAVIFLVRMWKLTCESRYLDEAISQLILYHTYLFDAKYKLYHHVWYVDEKRSGGAYWGRGNGWMMLAFAELLDYLPEKHPQRKQVLSLFTEQIQNLIPFQQDNGLWCQVLNLKTSYPESSCSAMITYSIARGINKGWLTDNYCTNARKGWNGLLQKLTPNNDIESVCVGTHFSDNVNYYLTRPKQISDRHVLGSFLMAGAEITKLNEKIK